MCKLMFLTDASKIKSVKKAVNVAKELITARDRDGYGWYAQGENGAYGERMSELFHGYRLDKASLDVQLPIVDRGTYESFGSRGKVTGALVFHGRTSTNSKSLRNTHPIVRNGWTLSHNGVVNNNGDSYEMLTSNDTEHLVHYISTEGISAIERNISGYYAFAALDPEGMLHVTRDSIASLYVAWIKSIESYIFATTIDLIEEYCKEMGWKHGAADKVQDNIYMVFNNNQLMDKRTIQPFGYDKREADLMDKSLGYTIFEDEDRKENDELNKIDSFLEACDYLDPSAEITNEADEIVSFEAFRKMDDMSKLSCVIRLADGTVLTCPADFIKMSA